MIRPGQSPETVFGENNNLPFAGVGKWLITKQSQKKRQNHICPLQLDIVERLIERYSNKSELVFDPFGGIGTVPYCAIRLKRKGLSTELNYDYWKDSLSYLYEAEMEVSAPTLFDLMDSAV